MSRVVPTKPATRSRASAAPPSGAAPASRGRPAPRSPPAPRRPGARRAPPPAAALGLALARRPARPRRREPPAERQRPRPLGRRQVGVARAHRQPVRLAHDGHPHHLDARGAGPRASRADDLQLLEVLLAEQRHVRPGRARSSLVTTVATPRKCPGRRSPHRPCLQPVDLDEGLVARPGTSPRPRGRTPRPPPPARTCARSPSRSRG